MKAAYGTYLNVYEERRGGKDVFVLLNEPNTTPTDKEYLALEELVVRELRCAGDDNANAIRFRIENAIEESGLACVDFGVQVIVMSV